MDGLLELLLVTFVRRGQLRVTTEQGSVLTFGDGGSQSVSVRFTTTAAQLVVMLDPEVKLGEAYMNGTLVIEQGSIADLLAIVRGQSSDGLAPRWAQPQWALRFLYRRL